MTRARGRSQIQSAIKLDRTYDVYWLNPPQRRVRIIKNRREKYWGTQTRMPIILRNLAPETTFDPRVTWDREKEAIPLSGQTTK